MVDTASSTLLATINQALLMEQGIAIAGLPFELDGQWMVGVQDENTRSSYTVPLSSLPQTSQPVFNTPGVFRPEAESCTCVPADPNDNVCWDSTTEEGLRGAMRQIHSCDPMQREAGQDSFAYAVEEQTDSLKTVIQESPEEVAQAMNQLARDLPPERYASVREGYVTLVQSLGSSSSGTDSRTSVALTTVASGLNDPDLQRVTVAAAMGTTPPPAGQVSTPTTLVTTSGVEISPRTDVHSVSPANDPVDAAPIGSLTIPPERIHEVCLAATSPAVSNQEFVEMLLPPSGGTSDLGNFLYGLAWTQPEVSEQVLGSIRQGIAGLLEDIPESHRPPQYHLEFFYHHNAPRSDDSIEIAIHPSEAPNIDPFGESGLLEGGGLLSYGRRHTAAGFGVFSFFQAALGRTEGDTGSGTVFVPVPPPNLFGMTEPRRGIFATIANPRGGHATERATTRIEGNPQSSDHGGDDQGGRGEGGRHGRDGHHGHGGHDEENPDDPYATWSETAPEEPATANA